MKRNRKTSLDEAIDEYKEFIEANRYAMNMVTMYRKAGPFLEDRRVRAIDEVSVKDCREFAKHLRREVDADNLAASSAKTTYAQFRSWLDFCVRDEMIDDNPAKKRRAEEMVPEPKNEKSQQFWSKEDREDILDAADDQAAESIDELDDPGWALSFRNRALTYVLSYSGTRIAETVASSYDDERNGIRWKDVDLDGGSVRVLGKNREYEHMQLPSPAAAVLAEYSEIVQPASDEWPVFPSGSGSKLYQVARQQLADRGLDEDEREELLADREIYDVYREEGLVPPSMTDSGFKTGFWYDFVEEYDLFIDGERPEFHAARRGLGDELYRENPRLAQSALRHEDLRTTHEAYSDIQAGETASEVDEMMDVEEPREFLQDDEDGEDGEAGTTD